jgi:hypothetical protein
MCERLVNVDRETPMLLPADLRELVPADDLVHSEAGIPGVAAPGAGREGTTRGWGGVDGRGIRAAAAEGLPADQFHGS